MGTQWTDGYSADVQLFLVVDGERIPLSHVSDKNVILRKERAISSGTPAKLVIVVDGSEVVRDVVLPAGTIEGQETVNYV